MESSISRPIIIEFNGLPGTGKTTICIELEKRLSEKGFVCVSSNYSYTKLKKGYLLFNPQNLIVWLAIVRIVFITRPFRFKKRAPGIFAIVKYYYMYKLFAQNPKADFLIIDQGILQGILSFFYLDKIERLDSFHYLIKRIKRINPFFVMADCECGISLAKERIIKRNRIDGRIDNMKDDALINALKLQQTNINKIRNYFTNNGFSDTIKLDTSMGYSNSVNQIMSSLNI